MGFFSTFFNSRPPDNQNSQFRGWASSPEAINGSFSSEHQRQQQSLAQQIEWQRVRRAQHHIYEEREAELLSAFEEERLSWGERMEAFFGRMMETINDLLGHIDEQEDSFLSEIDNLRDEIRDLENPAQQPPTGCCEEPPDPDPDPGGDVDTGLDPEPPADSGRVAFFNEFETYFYNRIEDLIENYPGVYSIGIDLTQAQIPEEFRVEAIQRMQSWLQDFPLDGFNVFEKENGWVRVSIQTTENSAPTLYFQSFRDDFLSHIQNMNGDPNVWNRRTIRNIPDAYLQEAVQNLEQWAGEQGVDFNLFRAENGTITYDINEFPT